MHASIPHEHLRDRAFHAFMSLISRMIAYVFTLRACLIHAMLNLCEFVKYSSDSASLNFGSDQTPFRDPFQNIVVLRAERRTFARDFPSAASAREQQ
jgi:hypothetical protein